MIFEKKKNETNLKLNADYFLFFFRTEILNLSMQKKSNTLKLYIH